MLPSWQGRNAKIVVYLSVKCPIDLHSLPGSTEGFCCVMMALFSITRRLLCTVCTANTVQSMTQSTTLHCSDYNQLVVVIPIYRRILQHHDGIVLNYETTTTYRLHCKYCTKYDSKYHFTLFRLQPIGCCNANLLKVFAAIMRHLLCTACTALQLSSMKCMNALLRLQPGCCLIL